MTARRPLLFASLLILAACGDADYRPSATGPERDVQIIVDSAAWNGPVGDALRAVIEAPVVTLPTPERAFDARHAPIITQAELEAVQQRKNVLIAAALPDTTTAARIIDAHFSDAARAQIQTSGRAAIVRRDDLWRRHQCVVFVAAPDDSSLARAIRADARAIRSHFEDAIRSRMAREMFERGRQEDVEQHLLDTHGFAVGVQHDFVVARDTAHFVWLRRVLANTWRSVFVFWIDDFDAQRLDSAFVVGLRDSLAATHLTGSEGGFVQIDRRLPLDVRPRTFLGRAQAWEMRGVWAMLHPRPGAVPIATMAGPFVNYTFFDPTSRRLYSIDGMSFAPGPAFSNLDFLRQVDVIAHTFQTRGDVQAAEAGER